MLIQIKVFEKVLVLVHNTVLVSNSSVVPILLTRKCVCVCVCVCVYIYIFFSGRHIYIYIYIYGCH